MSKLTIDTNAPKVQTQAPQATEPATDGKDAALAAIIQQVYGKPHASAGHELHQSREP